MTRTPPLPAPAAPAASPSPRATLLELALVAGATLVAYSGSIATSFHFDDLNVVVGSAALRELWPPGGPRWLGELTFALNRRLGGDDPLGFHVVNVLVHVGAALLVHRLAAALLRTPALRHAEAGPLLRRFLPLAAALLFALHPLQTEAVTYVVQRFASLATLLYLASLVLFLEARLALDDAPGSLRRAALPYGLSLAAAAGAMATKEIAVTLPAVAAGLELLLFGARPRRRLLLLVPLAAAALLVPLQQREVLSDLGRWSEEAPGISPSHYLWTQTRVVLAYLRLLLLPAGQSFDHDVALSRSFLEPGVLAAIAVHLAVGGLALAGLVRARREGRAAGALVFLGVAWFYATLSVESSVVPLRDVMVEHRVYLPSAGAALALATLLLAAVERLPVGPLRCGAALVLVAAPLGAATFARNRVYADELTLWGDAAAKAPGKARPHQMLGAAYLRRRALPEAVAELRAALRIEPRYPEALANLCDAYAEGGALAAAVPVCEQAVRAAPESAVAHNNLGTVREELGDLAAAIRSYEAALRLAPGMPEAAENLARVRGRQRAAGGGR